MVYLTALLPVREDVATYAALDRITRERGPVEARSRGQIMADALFERVTGYHDVDHVQPYANGGATTAFNGQGLCERCNYAKEAVGWQHTVASPQAGSGHSVTITTPTGHTYRSQAPPMLDKPAFARSQHRTSRIERSLAVQVAKYCSMQVQRQ